jgi:class 3 adenylate cyclase/HAMP domain-containing protein
MIDDFIKFIKKILRLDQKKKKPLIRKVYFGLRIRFLGFLFIVIFFFILFYTIAFFSTLRFLLMKEKKAYVAKLTQILSAPAEEFLDRDKDTIRKELIEKYNFIQKESLHFIQFDKDIIKIWLVNNKAKVVFSTFKGDENKTYWFSYFIKALEQPDEKITYRNFTVKNKEKKTKERFLAITYPVFLHKGKVIEILKDFDELYEKFYDSNAKTQRSIYLKLWGKYKDFLTDEFDPTKYSFQDRLLTVQKAWDIDFLFLHLFINVIHQRQWRIKKGESTLWRNQWLFYLKQQRLLADNNNKPKSEIEYQNQISEKILYLKSQIKEATKLGALAILYNRDSISNELNQHIKIPFIIALVFLVVSLIAFLFVINFMIKNIKILEKWAMDVSKGDIEQRVDIKTNDEIGRLSDIFNYMLSEIKTKFHLEKFVSKSTRKMINKRKESSSSVSLGRTGRKKYAFIFSDVRGFTTFSEKNDPAVVMEVLNFYFDLQAKIIKSKKGDIDDYVGDQIMAHFGGEKRADTAIHVASQIMREVKKINEKKKKNNEPYFDIGIGIHGGEVVVGNIGTGFRMDFACVGDTVNVTSRLCASADSGQILVSKELFSKVKGKYKIKKLDPILVKGKSKKIEVIEILQG